jgi:YHS domain-containing protein
MKFWNLIVVFALISQGACQSDNHQPTAPVLPEAEKSATAQPADHPASENQPVQEQQAMPARPKPVANPHRESPQPQPEAAGFANTVDFICDMKVQADYTDTCHYKGKVFAFCSEYCRDAFKESPEKYLSEK